MKRLYLIRHGETDANKAQILQGHLDTRLNSQGQAQASQLGYDCRSLLIDVIHSSDLSRAKTTAEQLALHHSCPVILSEQLREVSYGTLEGKTAAQLSRAEQLNLQQFYQAQAPLPYPKAETIEQLESRLLSYIQQILASSQQNHAIISHGQALNCLIHLLLGWSKHNMYKLALTNCSITELTFDQFGWQLIRLNQNAPSILKGDSQ